MPSVSLTSTWKSPLTKSNECKAVIANGRGYGCVLWFSGDQLYFEIDGMGGHLSDLALDDAPEGISVWEGRYVWYPGSYEHPTDGWSEPVGVFRDPTPEEWAQITKNQSPWNYTGPSESIEITNPELLPTLESL